MADEPRVPRTHDELMAAARQAEEYIKRLGSDVRALKRAIFYLVEELQKRGEFSPGMEVKIEKVFLELGFRPSPPPPPPKEGDDAAETTAG